MKEGENYTITVDPNDRDGWCVILKGNWDKVVGRFKDIQITDRGTKMDFAFEPLFVPEKYNIQCTEFDMYISDVLADIIREQHARGGMIYHNIETGERVDYE